MKTMVKFNNSELAGLANILSEFKLKGKASLGRTVLIRKLAQKQDEYVADRMQVQQKYFETDEQGNLKTVDDDSKKLIPKPELVDEKDPSKLSSKSTDDLNDEMSDLNNEETIIDFSEYSPRFKALKVALDDYPYELSSQDAVAYARIYDQLESAFTKEDN